MILDVICLALTFVFFWSMTVVLLGLVKPSKVYRKRQKKLRFTVLVCARNEENVVAFPIKTSLEANYPQGKIRVVVLADNCSDATVQVAKLAGAEVWEKTTPSKGKGDVLNWGIGQLKDEEAIAVFDADNQVDREWFNMVNDALQSGETVVTGCRHSSNPGSSVISGWYTVYWDVMNELSNRVRTNLGLSGKLTGTGFAFKYEVVKAQGWNTRTMVEDVEFSVQCNLAGGRISYVPDADYADEQPESFRAMWRQLRRWATGGWQVARHYGWPWARAMARKPSLRLFDSYFAILTGMSVAFVHFSNLLALAVNRNWHFFCSVFGSVIFMSWFMGFSAVALSKKGGKPGWLAILTFPVFSLILSASVLVTLVYPTKSWKPIAHGN